MQVHKREAQAAVTAPAPVVGDANDRQVHRGAMGGKTAGDVGVFEVKEKAGIKTADGLHCPAAHPQAAAAEIGRGEHLGIGLIWLKPSSVQMRGITNGPALPPIKLLKKR